jgi:geranylgeranyl pyrophosphate synthase
MTGASLQHYLAGLRAETDQGLRRVVDQLDAPADIRTPLAYALSGPGKRLRPCLTLAAAEAVAVQAELDPAGARLLALPGACAVEMVHTYSLVHDDLPAMDNDDLRRGRPTTHVVHGEAMAILAGDGLLTDAFQVLAAAPSPAVPVGAAAASAPARLRAVVVLARAAGSRGMVGGQAIDVAAVGRAAALTSPQLQDMHARKTGALIRAAASIGAILAGGSDGAIDAIDEYAAELGLAFQIIDDVLDVEGSATELGKTAGKDAAQGKPTFPAIYGLDRSRQMAAECIERAVAHLAEAKLGGRLAEIARWSLARRS